MESRDKLYLRAPKGSHTGCHTQIVQGLRLGPCRLTWMPAMTFLVPFVTHMSWDLPMGTEGVLGKKLKPREGKQLP